ncbi:MAG: sulfide dehydrogenase [Chlorobiaceae bacterium]|nr:sulfide dehydrogenase [Chlorobiaceae bacterium]
MALKYQIFLVAGIVSSVALHASVGAVAAPKRSPRPVKVVEPDPRGQNLALSCAGCHNTDGKSVGIIPAIYGKTAEYIESAMKDFRSGNRPSTVMGRHAKGYSDEEIHLIARYFGELQGNNK